MAPAAPPDIPNTFVDCSANSVTLTNADGSTQFTLSVLFYAYTAYNVDLHNGHTNSAVPVGYADFSAHWNQDPNCPYRFSMYNPVTAAVTTIGAPFPAGFLDSINPPPVLRPPTPPVTFEFSADQNDVIQHMLWHTAHRESFVECKHDAARTKKVDDRHSKHEEYRACDAAMGRACTPQKDLFTAAATTTGVIAIACGGGTAAGAAPAAPIAAVITQNSAAPHVVSC